MEIVETTPKPRPGLLTALCILSFIGSGLGVINNLMGMIVSPIKSFLTPEFFDHALENIPDEDPFIRNFVEQAILIGQEAMEHIFEISLSKFILYALSLTGAIFMFQLKKTGFYLYATAQILLLFVPSIFIGFNLFINIEILFASIFTILFIALYAINLKNMN